MAGQMATGEVGEGGRWK